jgi:nicotinate-nucleotide pyrophosphorylase (carboxylating)
MRSILVAERTALNFLQRLSGIATLTARYAERIVGTPAVLLDTRKTTPGWRLLEKYAVRCGGGTNHRLGLYDGVLIKDNHLAALRHGTQGVAEAVAAARSQYGQRVPIEVEVDTLEQLDVALTAGPDIILLDNMGPERLRQAIARRDALAPSIRLEASGGVNLDTIAAIAATGIDRISVGALTHSAIALDIGLDYEG